MKKKTTLVIIIIILICVAFFYFKHVFGWIEFKGNTKTPKEFLNETFVSKEGYSNDSILIEKKMKEFLIKKENSFSGKKYSELTELNLDTILYSPDKYKIAIFIIAKTPFFIDDIKGDYLYDAFCYIGFKENDSINIKWLKRFYPINWENKKEVSKVIREEYFIEFSTLKDTNGISQYKYNLDDRRFWECSVWDEYFHDRNKQ